MPLTGDSCAVIPVKDFVDLFVAQSPAFQQAVGDSSNLRPKFFHKPPNAVLHPSKQQFCARFISGI